MPKNLCYAQSGGPTAVINETARAVIETAVKHPTHINNVLAGLNGITGVLNENLIDTSRESDAAINALRYTPGAAFGSCRYKLKDWETHQEQYKRIIDVFDAHNVGYFLYNGGNDSHDTVHKIAEVSQRLGYPLTCIGLPKTIDNDLPQTDCCPGFGSAGKYLATTILETYYDLRSMAATSTQVFILEVMGRHTGWLAATSGLACEAEGDPPHLIIFPEIAFDPEQFLKQVKKTIDRHGLCTIVVSEGVRNKDGHFLSDVGVKDAFGHTQLGGVAPVIANLIKSHLGLKYHWAVANYMQRAARHLVSKTDLTLAYAIGQSAVEFAVAGHNAVMPTIIREQSSPYIWRIESAPLGQIANAEKRVPRDFITEEGFHITEACRDYLSPLIQGEDFPPFENGLPAYQRLKNHLVEKKVTVTT